MLSPEVHALKTPVLSFIRDHYRKWQRRGSRAPAPHVTARMVRDALAIRGRTLTVGMVARALSSLCTDGQLSDYTEDNSRGFMPL